MKIPFVYDAQGWVLILIKTCSILGFNSANYLIVEQNSTTISFILIFLLYVISSFVGIFLYNKLKRNDIEELKKIKKKWRRFLSIFVLFFTTPALFAIYYKDKKKYTFFYLMASNL